MDSVRYQEALDYLYSFIDYSIERSFRYSPELFELSRVSDLLSRLGNPHTQYPSVQIAGTKGKGSVGAFIESCLRSAGLRTGLYTSPHLQHFTERIRVNGSEIEKPELVELVDEIKDIVPQVPDLTTYELITAMGFLYFAHQEIDIAVLEVGLGGRLDGTNVITPLTSVITSISYDHMHLLGNRLSDIASEKAGIIKEGIPVVSSPQQYEVEVLLKEQARQKSAPLVLVGRDLLFASLEHSLAGQSFYLWSAEEQASMNAYIESGNTGGWSPARFETSLLGYHQISNAATAYAAIKEIEKAGFEIDERAIREGFRNTTWPGRFQVLSRTPTVVVDCAHNRDSALKLRIALDDYFPGQNVTLIFGASEDKDIAGILTELMPRASRVVLTQAVHPRAASPEFLKEFTRTYGRAVELISPVSAAFDAVMKSVAEDEVVLATGSLFVVGEILEHWGELKQSKDSILSSEES